MSQSNSSLHSVSVIIIAMRNYRDICTVWSQNIQTQNLVVLDFGFLIDLKLSARSSNGAATNLVLILFQPIFVSRFGASDKLSY